MRLLIIILIMCFVLPVSADEITPLRIEPEPELLMVHRGDHWYYQMSDKTLRSYDHKLKGVKDSRYWSERLAQTDKIRRWRSVAVTLQPIVSLTVLVLDILR